MATATRSLALARRREQVADLALQGWTQGAIARQLGIAQTTVSNDLKAIQKVWRDSAVRDFDLCREVELQKIDRVEREAWSAWERSQKPAQSARFQEGAGAGRTDKTVRNQHGDARFLELVLRCSSERRGLLGLNLETPIVQNNVSIQLTHDERERHITALLLELQEKLPAPQT